MPANIMDGSGGGLLLFLDRTEARGEMNPATARAFKAATRSVLSLEPDPDHVDVRGLDVDEILSRFQMLRRGNYSDGSMATYKSRFRQSVAMYIAWLDQDPNWKIAGKARSDTGEAGRRPRQKRVATPAKATAEPFESTTVAHDSPVISPGTRMVAYDMPLRPDMLVRITLPIDLTTNDADRVASFVRSLAFERDDKASPRGHAGDEH